MSKEQKVKKRIKELGEIYRRFRSPLETRFEEEVEKYWGRDWGVTTEVGKLRMVLLHRPGKEMGSIQKPLEKWGYTEKLNLDDMEKDFERLTKFFRDEDVEVVERKPESNAPPRLVKSIYTRDPSFAVKGGVIIGRMYDALRRGEELPTMQTYAEIGCPILHTVHGSGTIEGGSVMWLDPKHLVIGLSYRTNKEGARQVREVMNTIDPEIEVKAIPVYTEEGHIDTAITMIDVKTAVVDREVLPRPFIDYLKDIKIKIIEKPPDAYVEGVALEPGRILVEAGEEEEKQKGRKLLEAEGFEVIPVEISTLTIPRNSGTIHCLTMPIIRDPEPTG